MSVANLLVPAGLAGTATATAFEGAIESNTITAASGTAANCAVVMRCDDDDFSVFRLFASRTSGGGLLEGQLQLFAYSSTVGVSQVLSVDGATGDVAFFNPVSHQNNPITGVIAVTGGDASGLAIGNTTGGVAFTSGTRNAAAVDGSAATLTLTPAMSGRVVAIDIGGVDSVATLPDATNVATPDGLTYHFVVAEDAGVGTCSVVAASAAQLIGRLYAAGAAPTASNGTTHVGIEFAVGDAATGDSVRATLVGNVANAADRFWLVEVRCLNAAGAAWTT